MSHRIIAHDANGEKVLDVNVSGSLKRFYDFFQPSADMGWNGDGGFQTCAGGVREFLSSTPPDPYRLTALNILRDELKTLVEEMDPDVGLNITCL